MSIFVDVLLAVTFFGIVFVNFRRGFMRSVILFARVALSVLVTFLIGPVVAQWLADQQSASLEVPMYLISYALVFAIMFVVMTIIAWQVGKLVQLPVLKQCDKLLGIVLGVITGFVAVSIMACMLYFILRIANASQVYEESKVFQIWLKLPNLRALVEKLG